jgi:predicted DNA-binding protein
MAEEKFVIRPKKVYGENTVVSCRMPLELVNRLDEIGRKTGRTRNELILRCIEFSLDKLEIVED